MHTQTNRDAATTDARPLEGKVAVVTGGSSGIGLASARRLRAAGASVVLFARDPAALAVAARGLGEGTLAVPGDVTRDDDLDRLFAAVASRYDGIDALFVNAGIAEFVAAAEVTGDHFDRVFATNVRGAFFTIQRAMPRLRPGAAIVLNTSVADRVGAARTSVYAASKAALRSLARTLSTELLPRGVRVNAVSPGPTETPIHGKYARGLSPEVLEAMGKATMSRVPLGRLAKAEEIAEAVLFLASPASSFIVGQELAVDGGLTAL
jgi:NAD(P)-dependent dehydrogenase (short-subunit alcohol dehydrogenase family)